MNALRWILVTATGGVCFGLVVLVVVGSGFRRSFGASPTSPLVVVLPFLGLAVLLAGLLFPGQRWLLHGGALASGALLVSCVINMSSASLVGIAYASLWLVFYFLVVWRGALLP